MTTKVNNLDSKIVLKKISDFESKYSKKKEEVNYFKIFSHYVQSSNGTHKLFKLLIDACRWPLNYASVLGLSSDVIKKMFDIQGKFSFIAKGTIVPKYPNTIDELNKSFHDYQKIEEKEIIRKRDKLASKVAQAVADSSLLIQLGEVFSLYTLGSLSSIIVFVGNIFGMLEQCFNLKMGSEDYYEHSGMQKSAATLNLSLTGRIKTLFHEAKNLDLLNVAKAVTSISLGIFLLLDNLFNITLLTAGGILFLSTCCTVLTIWAHFYKESQSYPKVD